MASVLPMQDDFWATEAAVCDPIANILLEDLSTVTAHTVLLIIILDDVVPYFGFTDFSELLLAEEDLDILYAHISRAFFIVALVGTFELYLFVLFVALLFPAAVGDALPAEGVPAVLEGEVGPYYVLAEDALRVYFLVYLVYLVLALLDHLDVAAELDRLVAEVYLVGELSLPVLRLEGFCYLEDLVYVFAFVWERG